MDILATHDTLRTAQQEQLMPRFDLSPYEKCIEYDIPFLLHLPQSPVRQHDHHPVYVAWPEEIMYASRTTKGYAYTEYLEIADAPGFYAPRFVKPAATKDLVVGMNKVEHLCHTHLSIALNNISVLGFAILVQQTTQWGPL
ncbi:unnamed protein product [Peniophora sp. CBMAI 1063]|nr:unnamed protein product [Peniophora sp. CBMAI 1063]